MSINIGLTTISNGENFILDGFYQTTEVEGISRPTSGNDFSYYLTAADDHYGWSVASGDGVLCIGVPGDEVGGSGADMGVVETRYLFRGHTANINSGWANNNWSNTYKTLSYYNPSELLPDVTAGTASYGFGSKLKIHRGKLYVGSNPGMSESQASGMGNITVFGLQQQYIDKISKPSITGWNDADSLFGSNFVVGCGKLLTAGTEGAYSRAVLYDLDNLTQYITIDHPDGLTDTGKFGVGDTAYGGQLAIGYNRLVISASYDDHDTAVDGQSNPLQTGRSWVFDIEGNLISELAHTDSPALDDRFGHSVAIGCGLIIVSAPQEESADKVDNYDDGALYVYSVDGEYLYKIESNYRYDQLGAHVQIKYNRIYVTTVNSTAQNDTEDIEVYRLDGTFVQKISHTQVDPNSGIGMNGIDIGSGQRLLIGAPYFTQGVSSAAGVGFVVERASSQNLATYYDEYMEYFRY